MSAWEIIRTMLSYLGALCGLCLMLGMAIAGVKRWRLVFYNPGEVMSDKKVEEFEVTSPCFRNGGRWGLQSLDSEKGFSAYMSDPAFEKSMADDHLQFRRGTRIKAEVFALKLQAGYYAVAIRKVEMVKEREIQRLALPAPAEEKP